MQNHWSYTDVVGTPRSTPGVARFGVVVAGRRFGKTHMALSVMLMTAITKENSEIWYIAPSYRQAKRIAWKKLKSLVPRAALARRANESELTMELKNGSILRLMGGQNADDIKGVGLDGVVLDEYGSMNPNIWVEAVRPMLSDKMGWALFTGTPKGYNHFYDLYQLGLNTLSPEWRSWQFTTEQGGNVPRSEIEAAKADMDERTYRQEYLASFESLAGRVYYNFDRAINIDYEIEDDYSPLLVGMDFNINPMSATMSIRKGAPHRAECHTFAELVLENSNTTEMAQTIKDIYGARPKSVDDHTPIPREIIVCPDPAGGAGSTKATLGETDLTILRRMGFRVLTPGRSYAILDRINTTNALLKDANGVTRKYIHPSCKRLIKSYDGLTYKEGTKLPDKSSGLDHMTDADGYMHMAMFPSLNSPYKQKEVLL